MKCAEVENYLDDYIAGELDFSNARKIESHLRECRSCEMEAKVLKNTSYLLKTLSPIVPSAKFDAQMMQAFRKHQRETQTPTFWTTFFANFSISKPALAFALLALILFTGAAFQLGRITSPNTQTSQNQSINQSAQADEPNQIVKIIEKRIEIPVIKTVEVPVYREKIVNQIVYRNRENIKTIKTPFVSKTRDPDFKMQNITTNKILNNSEVFTPINLKDFQPFSEIRVSLIKKEQLYEK